MRVVPSSVLAAVVLPAFLGAQAAVSVHPLGPLTAESRENFGLVQSVRALSDGRVLVNDASKHRLLLLDQNLGNAFVVADSTPGVVNGHGGMPGALISYLGDSTLYVDMTSLSFLVVDPAGKITRVMSAPRPNDVTLLLQGSPGIDREGRLTYRGSQPVQVKRSQDGQLSMPQMADTAPVFRVDVNTRKVDTAAFIKIPIPRINVTFDQDVRTPHVTVEINPLPVIDDWALMSDGSLAIVRGQDYHVDWLGVDGARSASGKVPYDWQRLSDDDKVAVTDSTRKALEAAQAAGLGQAAAMAGVPVAMATRVGDGNVTVQRADAGGLRISPAAGDGKGAQGTINMVSPSELPDYRPAFRANATRPAPNNTLWVATTAPVATMPGSIVYDVIDREGKLVDRVAFPAGRQLIGFGGNGDVYITWRDGMGMHLGRATARSVSASAIHPQ